MHKYQRNTIKSYLKISAKNKTTTHIYNNKIKTYKILIHLKYFIKSRLISTVHGDSHYIYEHNPY
jgi:hypothetical protein